MLGRKTLLFRVEKMMFSRFRQGRRAVTGKDRDARFPSRMGMGLLLAALGLWLLTSPGSVIVLIQFSVAAVLIFHGVIDLQGAVSLARLGISNWWVDLVLAALTVVLGGVVLLNPFGTMEAMTMLIGASLVYDGASDLYLIYRVSKAFRDGGDL